MTLQTWEKASGVVHKIKKLEALIAETKKAKTAQELAEGHFNWSAETRERVRQAIVDGLETELAREKMQLSGL